MYDAVVLDNDGVLVGRTSYDVLREATWSAFETLSIDDPDPDDVESMVVGVSPEQLSSVADRYGVSAEDLWAARDLHAHRRQRREIEAGRKDLYPDVSVLREVDAPLGIVSSNQQQTVDYVLDHFGVRDMFASAVGRNPTPESLRRKKPNSHYLDRVVSELDADTALFVGDNESDLRAADNAGVDSAFIRRPHREEFDLSVTPTYDVADLHELVAICRR
ncbi:HAD family hydrolase [Halobaculum sp. MBLA0143]|uniref:HAD family hydrolase n=1 Tax=Halobaculum sp. MBLA0143 TaxID=3079933 RepID=UPI0035253E14